MVPTSDKGPAFLEPKWYPKSGKAKEDKKEEKGTAGDLRKIARNKGSSNPRKPRQRRKAVYPRMAMVLAGLAQASQENTWQSHPIMTSCGSHNMARTLRWKPPKSEKGGEEKDEMPRGTHKPLSERKILSIISANIHALRPRAEVIKGWDSDILLLQETKLAPHAIGEVASIVSENGWNLIHGKPCATQNPRRNTMRTHAATEATSGGVAIMSSLPKKPITLQPSEDEAILRDTGRWVEAKIPIAGKARFLTVASYYGIVGASSDNRKKALNEHIINMAITKMIKAGEEPYLLCGDFNTDPEDSDTISAAIEAGLIIDVGHEWAPRVADEEDEERRRKRPDPTFSCEEPDPSMEGKGVTRIDLAFANPTAAAAVAGYFSRWDLVQERHVPQEVVLDLDTLDQEDIVQRTNGNVLDITEESKEAAQDEDRLDTEEAYDKIRAEYLQQFQAAIDRSDVNDAHVIWNKMAEGSLLATGKKDVEEVVKKVERAPTRGGISRVQKEDAH